MGQTPPTALPSEVSDDTTNVGDDPNPPTNDDMEDEYDNTAVIVSLTYVAFASSASSIPDMSN
jgi:hypothetical protein